MGEAENTRTLIDHWDGKAWHRQPAPSPGRFGNQLVGVAATSATDAWAVGVHDFGPAGDYSDKFQPLIEHWNGKVWKVISSPAVHGGLLVGVSAASARAAWAVGSGRGGGLIEQWNGKVWKVQRTPGRITLSGVAAASPTDAWAVGYDKAGTVIVHWNGKTWKREQTHRSGILYGVAAASATNAWAVGSDANGTLILHWNGKTWKAQPSPNPEPTPQPNQLVAVSASSPTNAWAVGGTGGRGRKHPPRTLIEHWNGKSWKVQPSPSPGSALAGNGLGGVAAVSADQAWAVGAAVPRQLILYWNGTAWKR